MTDACILQMLSTMAVELARPHYLVVMQAVISVVMRLKHGASHTPVGIVLPLLHSALMVGYLTNSVF
jgi:hypothetical protein